MDAEHNFLSRVDQTSYRIFVSDNLLKEDALNLEHAIAASCHQLACRVVDDRRVIVEYRPELLIIQIQRRSKRRWITDDNIGGIIYLMGILQDETGRYLCIPDNLSKIAWIKAYLPLRYQALLLPECDDWQVME
jgi:hypothetical protein